MASSNPPVSSDLNHWKNCNLCKKEIPFEGTYYVCSVSTCRSKKTGLVFCSSLCWDGHLGWARHRDSYCEEMKAPTKNQYLKDLNS